MKHSQAQVYIATTQGLVHVQSITALTDPKLRSVVSINSRSELAGISHNYADFVAPPQGIIQEQFGGFAYRLNISANIDQGNSWQLGVYLAHFLSSYYASVSNKPYIKAPQTIIVATGEINTVDHSVLGIQHLAKKCAFANGQIQTWLLQGKNVLFLVPTDNYRDPIPDSSIALTPISTLDQLPYLLDVVGLTRTQPIAIETGQLSAHKHGWTGLAPPELLKPDRVNGTSSTQTDSSNNDAVIIEATEQAPQMLKKLVKPNVITALSICLLLSIVLYTTYSLDKNTNGLVLQDLDYRYTAVVSENRASCNLANELAQNKRLPNPHIANLNGGDANGLSQFGNFVQLPAVNLNDVCKLTLLSSKEIKAVWLLSETRSLIAINPIVLPSENRQWSVPLPLNLEQQSQRSQYHLLIFTQNVDAADLQSLQSFLNKLHDDGQTHSFKELSQWSLQLSMSVIFLEHPLLAR